MVDRRASGFSVLESTLALTVIGLVATAFVTVGPRDLQATSRAARVATAERLASGVLEDARGTALADGTTPVALAADTALPGATAARHVRAVEPGLFEVVAVVTWTEPGGTGAREARVTTLLAARPTTEDAR